MNLLCCKTVGHSTYKIDDFVRLLKAHGVNCIVDVRSQPYSRFAAQFNRESLKTDLKIHDITYDWRGDCLGGRYKESRLLFADGKVDFKKVRQLAQFREGIRRVIDGIRKGLHICLMCAEKEPFNCHRFVLVSPELAREGVQVKHILSAGQTIRQEELEERLLKKYHKDNPQASLFSPPRSRKDRLAEAYELRNKEIASSQSR